MTKISLYLFLVSFIVAGTPTGTAARDHSHFKRPAILNLHVELTFKGKTATGTNTARPTFVSVCGVLDIDWGWNRGGLGVRRRMMTCREGAVLRTLQCSSMTLRSEQISTCHYLVLVAIIWARMWAEAQCRDGFEKIDTECRVTSRIDKQLCLIMQ